MIGQRDTPPRVACSREAVGEGGLREISGPAPTLTLVTVTLLGVWMGCSYGGYFVQTWAPVLFSGYASWTFASILWSPNKGDAGAGARPTTSSPSPGWIAPQ